MAKHEHKTTRLWVESIRNLKLLAALKDKSMSEVADELFRQELSRVKIQKMEDKVEDKPTDDLSDFPH